MKKTQGGNAILKRVLAFVLAFVMVAGYFPTTNIWSVSATAANGITTVADPQTLTRPQTIYGDNTLNAGKVTVGKSVSTSSVTVNGKNVPLSNPDNFLVTVSQSAQVMGLAAQVNVPVDVVFVLDTSGSMWPNTDMRGPKADGTNGTMNRSEAMVKIVNDTINALMELNSENRVGVVAFSGHNQGEIKDVTGDETNDAAIQLSPLASYTGEAAESHLTYGRCYVGWTNANQYSIHGRTASGDVSEKERYYTGGATNIQAGIAKGAQMLMDASLEQGNTRVPFLIVLSDGAPTVSSSNDEWWNPDMQKNQGNYTYMNGDDPVEGNSFLTLLTAAYYKEKVSERYTQYTGKKNDLRFNLSRCFSAYSQQRYNNLGRGCSCRFFVVNNLLKITRSYCNFLIFRYNVYCKSLFSRGVSMKGYMSAREAPYK